MSYGFEMAGCEVKLAIEKDAWAVETYKANHKNQNAFELDIVADGEAETTTTVIPAVAIECKTYLERNMLDSCAATASRLKNAMPYCIYIVASEYMKMSDAAPELTDIDEVYILCKAKNADRERRKRAHQDPFNIDAELIIDLYNRVCRHLNAIWWKPEDAVENGKIINRPT